MDSKVSIIVAAETKSLPDIHQFLETTVSDVGMDPDGVYDIRLAVEEAVVNSISHGYQGQVGKIEIEIDREDDWLLILIRDDAALFDPMALPEPDLDKPLMERALGGAGILLIRQAVDEIRYRVSERGGNELTLVKRINPRD